MEYFLKGEADKLQRDYSAHIGQDMVCNTEGKRAKLTNVGVMEGAEIVHMGQIQPGYTLLFKFGQTANVFYASYCIYNGLEPIIATKHALDDKTKRAIITQNNMRGTWSHKNGASSVEIEISETEIKVNGVLNGEKKSETIQTQGSAWMGPLTFNNTGYFINYAAETNLSFGRDYPEDKWILTLTRKTLQ